MSPRSPSPVPTATPANTGDGYFQCRSCNKYYNRADHLIRHVRSHTREKPYACHICHKGFTRPDLLKRHAAGHEREGFCKHRSPALEKNTRVSQACKSCAASKLKCNEDKPCQRCREKKIVCERVPRSATAAFAPKLTERQGLAESDSDRPLVMTDALDASSDFPDTKPDTSDYPTPVQFQSRIESSNFLAEKDLFVTPLSPHDGADPTISPTDGGSGIFSLDGAFFPEFIPESLPSSLLRSYEIEMGLSLALNHSNVNEFTKTNMQLDFDLTEVDYGLIDFFSTNGVKEGVNLDTDPAENADSEIALGVEAFHRSSLSAWNPDHRDHAFADHDNLSVSRNVIEHTELNISYKPPTLCEKLSSSSRDLIYGMVLYTSKRGNLAGIIKSFPSTELLDRLIQDYFQFQKQQVDSWIHCPTFQPNSEGPEILAALASAGATLSPIVSIRKLGYALMEMARLRLPVICETDNSITRDLRLSQAYALLINVGLWSGNGRKMEIAESSAQNLVTILRRALRYRRSRYSLIVPTALDAGPELNSKWRQWVEQESFKRLVYHVFLHDSQAAVTLNINSLISYSDLELPLPGPRRLWEAQSATEWKDIYLSLQLPSSERIPSLTDLLRDMSQLRVFEVSIDTQMAAFILLHGIMALIMEYHRLKSISKGNCEHWHALLLKSRHQELCTALQHFRTVCSTLNGPPRPEIDLLYEATSIFLYTSMEDLQLFAGKEDKSEARRAYDSAIEWINSIDSRRAILHAGQAVRAAKAIPGTLLRGFLAFAVYHAGLAFWSYSVISKANSKAKTKSAKVPLTSLSSAQVIGSPPRPAVFLDSKEMLEAEKFIPLAYGSPALHGPEGTTILVEDACQTMRVIQDVLRKDATNEALHPLILSLCQLMNGLGNAADGKNDTSVT